jgi:hypothetical protein
MHFGRTGVETRIAGWPGTFQSGSPPGDGQSHITQSGRPAATYCRRLPVLILPIEFRLLHRFVRGERLLAQRQNAKQRVTLIELQINPALVAQALGNHDQLNHGDRSIQDKLFGWVHLPVGEESQNIHLIHGGNTFAVGCLNSLDVAAAIFLQ